jgi:hypothetical protein
MREEACARVRFQAARGQDTEHHGCVVRNGDVAAPNAEQKNAPPKRGKLEKCNHGYVPRAHHRAQ